MAEEAIVLNEGGVLVSAASMTCKGKAFALADIKSAKVLEKAPSRKGPVIVAAIGVLSLGLRVPPLFAAVLLVIGIAWWFLQKTMYSVVLAGASGEQEAFTSKDSALVSRIVAAVNAARGGKS